MSHSPYHVTKSNFQNSPYFYWFEFLRLSNVKNWTKKVRNDFGKCPGSDFWSWWLKHEELFLHGTSDGILPVESMEEFNQAKKEKWAVVKIDLSCPKNYLRFYFDDFLKEHGVGHAGKDNRHKNKLWIVEPAKYSLAGRANVAALRMALKIYKLSKEKPELTQWEIGVELNANPNQIPQNGEDPDNDQRRVLTATVSRYLKRAEGIIRNVEKGIFPKNE